MDMLRRLLMMMNKAVAYATWNSGDKGSNVTLSNGNLTAAYSTYSGSQCRGTIGKSSDVWYWEILVSAISNSAFLNIGVALLPLPTADPLLYGSAGVHRFDGGTDLVAGDVLGFKLAPASNQLVVYRNNVNVAVLGLSAGGTWYPAFSEDNGGGTATLVANFGASAFTYSVPGGANAGLY